MSLNSNVLIPAGLSAADRAYLLGHSMATNLKHYSYEQKGVVNNARAILNKKEPKKAEKEPKILYFPKIGKAGNA